MKMGPLLPATGFTLFGLALTMSQACGSSSSPKRIEEKAIDFLVDLAAVYRQNSEDCDALAVELNHFIDDRQALIRELYRREAEVTQAFTSSWALDNSDKIFASIGEIVASGHKCIDHPAAAAANQRMEGLPIGPGTTNATTEGTPADDASSAESEAVTYEQLIVRVKPDTDEYSLTIIIDAIVKQQMAAVAPHVDIIVECGQRVEADRAFFDSFSKASPGTIKRDLVEVFEIDGLLAAPSRCEIRLQLSAFAKSPTYYCFESLTTREGRCAVD